MTELLTAAQMRAIEQAAIDSGQVTGLELMERAGRGVVEAVFEEWPELAKTPHRAVVLCGPGNNGGDGFVVARLLKESGWDVEVFFYGEVEKLPHDARVNYESWLGLGEVSTIPDEFWLPNCELLIDGLFGTGISREIPDEIAGIVAYLHKAHDHFHVVAIDAPSGLCLDSGNAIGELSGRADLTVTFQKRKIGHFLKTGPNVCGKVECVDLKLPGKFKSITHLMDVINSPNRVHLSDEEMQLEFVKLELDQKEKINLLVTPSNLWGLLKCNLVSGRTDKSFHKYTHGHALILSGPSGKGGAARLAARGALRIGAGVVTVGCPPDAVAENAAQLNAVMLEAVHDADALARVLTDTRINALCLGPGLGLERARELVPVALNSQAQIVLDADALSAYGDDPETLFELTSSHRSVVLTPHAGEFARLFPDLAKRLREPPMSGPAYSKVDATREAAKRAGCVVLFKGADTVIADPDGRAAINSAHYERAAPWLATAGSGDVLAGFITGLLARGFAPMQAAETAAWLHVECALEFGAGLIAEDLPDILPRVFKKLGV